MVEGGGEVDTWWRAAVRWTRGEGPAVRWTRGGGPAVRWTRGGGRG